MRVTQINTQINTKFLILGSFLGVDLCARSTYMPVYMVFVCAEPRQRYIRVFKESKKQNSRNVSTTWALDFRFTNFCAIYIVGPQNCIIKDYRETVISGAW